MSNPGFKGLPATNARIDSLMADFSGLIDLEDIVSKTLERLSMKDNVQQQVSMVKGGTIGMQDFDGWFSQVVRAELGKTLGIVRAKAVEKAARAGAGSAASAVYRRMHKGEYAGNINISGNRKRLTNKKRQVNPPDGGKSGIHRKRTVSKKTKRINEYFGPDRHFILRFLNDGTDTRTAMPQGPTGRRSMATYGNRSLITGKGFFHQMKSDMEQAANELGTTLINHVEKWVSQKFTETQQ